MGIRDAHFRGCLFSLDTGVGRALRPVNNLVRDWLLESQERPLRFLTAGQLRTAVEVATGETLGRGIETTICL